MKKELVRSTWPKIRTVEIRGLKFFQVDARRKGTRGKQETFSDKGEAQKRAADIAAEYSANGSEGLAISGELRFMAIKGDEMLKPFGKSVLQACEFYRDFLATALTESQGETVERLAKDWYDFKKDGKRGEIRKDSLIGIRRGQLELTKAFGSRPVASIKAKDITDYLDAQPIASISRRNLCNLFGQFFNWGIKERGLTANPAKGIVYASGIGIDEVVIWTPAEAEQAMRLCEEEYPEYIAFHAVGLFAGLRPFEAAQITWQNFDFAHRTIHVPKSISKVKDSRLVVIEENLLQWLELTPANERTGSLLPKKNFTNRIKTFRAKLGYRYITKQNGVALNPDGARGKYDNDVLRHSYGSYWLAINQNMPQLALNMGNSVEVINKHYKRLVHKTIAAQDRAILPKDAADKAKAADEEVRNLLANG